ncbi:Dabb family protein [Microbacterium sp. zg.Y909]|uniref:Dabb family protein n=1 Tax=Microbacterium sp. zg.Y909 TaxID=2969413 RepID=UPI00214B334C|nr:Dabb family protein [Microbacterium sp. zg.Y909]MCR2824237.1 Dabb family protein [Microbacterium sp. zg.Y909]
MAYRHVVLFRVYDGTTPAQVSESIRLLRDLGRLPGVVSWRVERSLDDRKGTIIIEDAAFADRVAYEAFRAHPAHVAAANALSGISDWWVGDYVG